MWILKKPNLADAKKDIDIVIAHSRGLDAADKPKFEQLYDDYDTGNGEVSPAQLKSLESKKDIIKGQYAKTSGKTQNGQNKPLVYIRTELNRGITKCPYCSINAPQQLDHYMDKDSYGQLATCRLNLVPLCATCNNLKGKTNYVEFTHPYYQQFPNADFFVATCKIVSNRIVATFSVNPAVITDTILRSRLNAQMGHIHLRGRLRKAINEFLSYSFLGYVGSTDASLKTYLPILLKQTVALYGRNDWRAAIVRGLIACPNFNMNVVNNMKFAPINRGGA